MTKLKVRPTDTAEITALKQQLKEVKKIQKQLSKQQLSINPDDKIYSAEECCKIFKIGRSTFELWKRQGTIKYFKIRGKCYVKNEEVNELITKFSNLETCK